MNTPDYDFPDFIHEVSFRKRPKDDNTIVTLRYWDSNGIMHKNEQSFNKSYEKNSFSVNWDILLDYQISLFKDYLQSKNVI